MDEYYEWEDYDQESITVTDFIIKKCKEFKIPAVTAYGETMDHSEVIYLFDAFILKYIDTGNSESFIWGWGE